MQALTAEIKAERRAEKHKVAEVEGRLASVRRDAEALLDQAETQFRLRNLVGQYGAYGQETQFRLRNLIDPVLPAQPRRPNLVDPAETKFRLCHRRPVRRLRS